MVNSAFVSSICSVQSVQSLCGKDDVLFGKDDRFLYLLFFFIFAYLCQKYLCQCLPCILMREAPTLSMCRHTNEGNPSIEHVKMLHWVCADMLMREIQ